MGRGSQVELILDASPWGLGGYLVEDGKICAFFASPIGPFEANLLQIQIAESSAQQTVEALAVLVALRAWKTRWVHKRVFVKVKSDSISALVLTFKLKTSGAGAGIVAREIALDVASSEYRPHAVAHIPGVENITADALSRKFDPGFTYSQPALLAGALETIVPPREAAYFRAALPPAASRRKRRYKQAA
jgi:hypothetical protein